MKLNEIKRLAKTANELDAKGMHKEADRIDAILKGAAIWEDDSLERSFDARSNIDEKAEEVDAIVDLVAALVRTDDIELIRGEVSKMLDSINTPLEPKDEPPFPEEDEFLPEREEALYDDKEDVDEDWPADAEYVSSIGQGF